MPPRPALVRPAKRGLKNVFDKFETRVQLREVDGARFHDAMDRVRSEFLIQN